MFDLGFRPKGYHAYTQGIKFNWFLTDLYLFAGSIPVTAEIVPVPMQSSQGEQANVILASSASSGAITSSSFMPSVAVSEAVSVASAASHNGVFSQVFI